MSSQSRHLGTVLVVEDEPPIRMLLEEALSTEGYSVRSAADATEALDSLEGDRADVVLLDLMLPDKTGLELAKEIREHWKIFIIAMSASTGHLESARRSPCVDRTVAKPFEWDLVLEGLQVAMT